MHCQNSSHMHTITIPPAMQANANNIFPLHNNATAFSAKYYSIKLVILQRGNLMEGSLFHGV